ncbi:MAG: hypothetical protein IH963_13270 [Chloroflexi bacterium]|nr:hypothetical protein [Chloroflexota bacterium]
MEQGTYKGDVLQKISGLSFIMGTILLVVFGLLHHGEDLEDLNGTIINIAEGNGGLVQIDHILIAVGFWALMIGMVGVYRSISSGAAAEWVRIGFYGLIIATALRAVFLAIDGVGLAMVVEQWEEATGADKATIFVTFSSLEVMLDGLRSMTDVFFGVALVLLGIGISISAVYPRLLGWAVIVAGAVWTVIGIVIGIAGSSSDLDILFAVAFILTIVSHLVMGIVITRREINAM